MVLGGLGTIARTCAMDADVDANGVGNGMAMGNGRKCLGRSGASLSGVSVFLKGRGGAARLRPAADGVGAKMDVRMGEGPKCIRFELFQNIQPPRQRRQPRQQKSLPKVCPTVSVCVCVCVKIHMDVCMYV